MGRTGCLAWCALVLGMLFPSDGEAQTSDRDREIRVGNKNVLTVGLGYREHDHPTFSEKRFFSMGYQRRILRREIRLLPLWVRSSFDFAAETMDEADSNLGIWPPNALPGPELVQERMSNFAIRIELLGDLIHRPTFALYGGGGFVVHILNYSNRTPRGTFKYSENPLGPSLVGGGRCFMRNQPWAVYAEARYGQVYGRIERPSEGFSDQNFELVASTAISFEGGLALHW